MKALEHVLLKNTTFSFNAFNEIIIILSSVGSVRIDWWYIQCRIRAIGIGLETNYG